MNRVGSLEMRDLQTFIVKVLYLNGAANPLRRTDATHRRSERRSETTEKGP